MSLGIKLGPHFVAIGIPVGKMCVDEVARSVCAAPGSVPVREGVSITLVL